MADNALLAALPSAEYGTLWSSMQDVEFAPGDVLFEPGDEVNRVYFPTSGLLSLVATFDDGRSVETGAIGRTGAVALAEVIGSRRIFARVGAQSHVTARWISAPAYCRFLDESSALRSIVRRYIELLLAEARYDIACHALHPAGARLARWLLVCADKTGDASIDISQEYLAQLIATQRTTVSGAAHQLKRDGLIHYGRGRITIKDRARLEERACGCYSGMKRLREEIAPRDGQGFSPIGSVGGELQPAT